MLEVFSVRSAFIHPTKPPIDTICVKAFAIKLTNNCVAFRLQFLPKCNVKFTCNFAKDVRINTHKTCRENECFLIGDWGSLSASASRLGGVFHRIFLTRTPLSQIVEALRVVCCGVLTSASRTFAIASATF